MSRHLLLLIGSTIYTKSKQIALINTHMALFGFFNQQCAIGSKYMYSTLVEEQVSYHTHHGQKTAQSFRAVIPTGTVQPSARDQMRSK